MPRSFFERLTGSVRVSEEETEPRTSRVVQPSPKTSRFNRPAEPVLEKKRVIHPVAPETSESREVQEEIPPEEGQLTVDIYDDGQNIMIQSTVAGVRPEEVDISLQDDTLTIRGQRRRQQEINEENFYYKELYWGSFSRSIILPEEVDFQKADAVIKNGLLSIKLPKKDRGEKKITVKAG